MSIELAKRRVKLGLRDCKGIVSFNITRCPAVAHLFATTVIWPEALHHLTISALQHSQLQFVGDLIWLGYSQPVNSTSATIRVKKVSTHTDEILSSMVKGDYLRST